MGVFIALHGLHLLNSGREAALSGLRGSSRIDITVLDSAASTIKAEERLYKRGICWA